MTTRDLSSDRRPSRVIGGVRWPAPVTLTEPTSRRRAIRHRTRSAIVAGIAAWFAASMTPSAWAAITWDGGNGDGDFASLNNWGGTDPDANDDGILDDPDLIFAGAVQTTVLVDEDYTNVDSIVFDTDADTFTINGDGDANVESLTFNDDAMIINNSTVAGDQTFGAGLELIFLGEGATITNNDANGDSAIVIESEMDIAGDGAFVLLLNGAGDIELNGNIDGAGASLLFSGMGTLTLGGQNTFDGGVIVNSGTVLLSDARGFGTGDVSFSGDATLGATGGAIANVDNDIGIGSGVTLTIGGSENLELAGDIGGGGSLVVDMDAAGDVLTLGGDNANIGGGITLTMGTVLAGSDTAVGGSGDTLVVDGADEESFLGASVADVDLATDISITNGTMDAELNLTGSNDFGISGVISGDGALEVGVDSGVFVTLNGENTFTGGTTIDNAGAGIVLGNDDALGTGDLTLTADGAIQSSDDARRLANDIVLGANTLTVSGENSLDIQSVISGTGGLTINMTDGMLMLSGTNTYSGTTTLTAGTLILGSDEAIGTSGFSIDGGTIGTGGESITLDEAITIGGDFTIADLEDGDLEFSGTVALGDADRTITTENDEDFTISGVISSTGQNDALIKAGDGVLILSGDNNAWNGGVTLNAGSIGIGDDNALGGGTFALGGDGSIFSSGINATVANTVDLGTNTLTITGARDMTLTGQLTESGGSGNLTMSGEGVLTIGNGASDYSGTTTLNSGTLLVTDDEAIGTSDLVFNGGSFGADTGAVALDENGTLNAAIEIIGDENLTLTGDFAGDGGFTVNLDTAVDVFTLGGTNTYTGETTVSNGLFLVLGGSALADTALVTLDDVAGASMTIGASETLGGIAGGGSTGGGINIGATTLTIDGLAGDAAASYDGAITGTGNIVVSGGEQYFNGDNTYTGTTTVTGGILGGSGSIDGDLSVTGGTFAVGETGTAGTFDVAGNAAIGASGTLEVTVNSSNLAQFDVLAVTGTATLADGSTLSVDIDQTSGVYIPSNASFAVLTAAGGITDNGVDITTESATLDFYNLDEFGVDGDFMNGDTSLSVLAIRAANAYSNPAVINAGNNRRIGAALDSLTVIADADATSDAATLLSQIQGLNATDLNNALEELTPVQAAVPSLVTSSGATAYSSVTSGYLAARRDGTEGIFMASQSQVLANSLASATYDPEELGRAVVLQEAAEAALEQESADRDGTWNVFAKIYGFQSDIDADGPRVGYDGTFFGIQGGLDYRIQEGLYVGLGIGYLDTDVDLLPSRGELAADTFRIGPYLTYATGPWHFDASATYGFTGYDQDRNVTIPGMGTQVAVGDYDGEDISVYLGAGYDFELADAWSLTPELSLQWVTLDLDGYTETGAGVNNMTLADRSSDSLRGRLGVTLSRSFTGERITIMPEFTVGWEHEFEEIDDVEARFAAGGNAFTFDPGSPIEDGVFVGVGFTAMFAERVTGYIRYDGLFGSGGDTHGVTGGLRISF